MKCELCHQRNAETVLLRPGKAGREEELYVCKACAEREAVFGETHGIQVAAMGMDGPSQGDVKDVPGEMGPAQKEFLGKMEEVLGVLSEKLGDFLEGGPEGERCPKCGMPLDEVRTHGGIGCAHCMKVFRKALLRLVDEVQGCVEYHGEPSIHFAAQAKRKALVAALKEALEREDYVKAKAIKAELAAFDRKGEEPDGR